MTSHYLEVMRRYSNSGDVGVVRERRIRNQLGEILIEDLVPATTNLLRGMTQNEVVQ